MENVRPWCGQPSDRERLKNRKDVYIFYRFRDIAGYLSKVADFDPLHLHLLPSQGVTPAKFRGYLASENQSPRAIVWCCLCDPVFFFVLVELLLVADRHRQTDIHRQTNGHRPMASTVHVQHRAVKIKQRKRNRFFSISCIYRGKSSLFSSHNQVTLLPILMQTYCDVPVLCLRIQTKEFKSA